MTQPFPPRASAPPIRVALTLLAGLVLGGCASFSDDGGFGRVERLVGERLGQPPVQLRTQEQAQASKERIDALLDAPLTPDTAVTVALLNHPGLQASYAELGIAEAELVRAGRLPNPSLRFGRLHARGASEIDRAVLFDVLALLTLPLTRPLEQQRFEQVQLEAADRTVAVAMEARRAYFDAVAARQVEHYQAQVKEAADLASELAARMAAAGNLSALGRMREQVFQSEATIALARARQRTVAARERLMRALGLPGDPLPKLPDQLPQVPDRPAEARDAEQTAMDRRLDLQVARRQNEATARALGLTRVTRLVNVLNVGWQNKSQTGEPRMDGYEVELELPLFDFGSTRVARAEAQYRQSMQRTAALAVQARSEVRESYSAYHAAWEVAVHHRDELVPLRQRISNENLLRYNGMLVGVFDLLADAREQVAGVVAAMESQRDFWIAETDLQIAIGMRPPTSTPSARERGPGTGTTREDSQP